MSTISTLQSQVALNRNIISDLECALANELVTLSSVKAYEFTLQTAKAACIKDCKQRIQNNKKQIKQYAKLQRALKSELAYRIMYNREMRSNNMEQYQLK